MMRFGGGLWKGRAAGFFEKSTSNSHSLEQLVGHITLSQLVNHFIVLIEADTNYPGQAPYAYVDNDKIALSHVSLEPWDLGQCLDCKAGGELIYTATSGKMLIGVISEVNPSPFSHGFTDNVTLGALPLCGEHLYQHAKKVLEEGVKVDPILEHLYVAAAIDVLQGAW